MFSSKLAAAVMSIGLVTMSGSAIAKSLEVSPANQETVVVKYDDLNLSSDAGAQVLRRRLADAVTQIKGDGSDGLSLSDDQERATALRAANNEADAVIKAHRDTAAAPAPASVSLG